MRAFRFDLFLSLIRAIFPRWDFFDRIAYHFDLEYETDSKKTWEKISFEQRLSPLNLLFNADVNEALAQMNVIEHFAGDVQRLGDSEHAESLTSYKLLRSLVWEKVPSPLASLRFRVVAVNPDERLVLYVSEKISKAEIE
ncbi:MAG: hypothetical protein KF789_09960 [Bdellovibrionaceae bacterium]|nr:hypothetical protein [Pseudobdellovibrionaceae bacterium]